MNVNIIQAKYDNLDAIAVRLGHQAEGTAALDSKVKHGLQALEQGGWEGKGARAFFTEMHEEVLPATQRLHTVLNEARSVMLQVKAILVQAEQQAAAIFCNGGSGASAGTGGAPTDAHDGSSVLDSSGLGRLNLKGHDGDPSFRLGYDGEGSLKEWTLVGGEHNNVKVGVGNAEGFAGVGFNKDGFYAGIDAEGSVASVSTQGRLGTDDFASTGSLEANAGAWSADLGIHNNSIGGGIGGSLASVKGSTGVNVAGYNVSAEGELDFGLNASLRFGQHTEAALGPLKVNLDFGDAL